MSPTARAMAGRDLRGISLEYPYVQKFERFKIPYILKQVLIVLTVFIDKGNRCHRGSEWRNHASLRTLSRLVSDFTLPQVTKEGSFQFH